MKPTGPTHAVVGDLDEPTKPPITQVPEEILAEEKKLAEYSQTAEYKRLKTFLEDRRSFYQNFLPNGQPIKEASEKSLGEAVINWKVANAIIAELNNILDSYEQARQAVNDAKR